MKLIFPYGCTYDYGHFRTYFGSASVIDVYNDLDRVLAIMDGTTLEQIHTVGEALRREFDRLGNEPRGPYSPIESTYFDIRFFKKGTVHLKFKRKDLHEKFCITASAGKRWLGEDTRHEHTEPSPIRTPPAAQTSQAESQSLVLFN
jgi:hypothetical protein